MSTKEQKERLKDKIISEVFNSKEVHRVMNIACKKAGIPWESGIDEDVVQEAFMHLSRKTADFIIELYEDNPKRVVGLTVRIAQMVGLTKYHRNKDLPSHSVMTRMMFASNFNIHTNTKIDCFDESEDDLLVDVGARPEKLSIETVYENLTDEESDFLENYVINNYKGKLNTKLRGEKERILNKVKEIIKKIENEEE